MKRILAVVAAVLGLLVSAGYATAAPPGDPAAQPSDRQVGQACEDEQHGVGEVNAHVRRGRGEQLLQDGPVVRAAQSDGLHLRPAAAGQRADAVHHPRRVGRPDAHARVDEHGGVPTGEAAAAEPGLVTCDLHPVVGHASEYTTVRRHLPVIYRRRERSMMGWRSGWRCGQVPAISPRL